MADELTAEGIQFHAVEPRSSVRERLRHEAVDSKLGGVNRFTTVADVIDHFLSESIAFSTRDQIRALDPVIFTTNGIRSIPAILSPWLHQ